MASSTNKIVAIVVSQILVWFRKRMAASTVANNSERYNTMLTYLFSRNLMKSTRMIFISNNAMRVLMLTLRLINFEKWRSQMADKMMRFKAFRLFSMGYVKSNDKYSGDYSCCIGSLACTGGDMQTEPWWPFGRHFVHIKNAIKLYAKRKKNQKPFWPNLIMLTSRSSVC